MPQARERANTKQPLGNPYETQELLLARSVLILSSLKFHIAISISELVVGNH